MRAKLCLLCVISQKWGLDYDYNYGVLMIMLYICHCFIQNMLL